MLRYRSFLLAASLLVLGACKDKPTPTDPIPITLPSLDSVNPGSGTVGTEVLLMGSNFAEGAQVHFGDIPADVLGVEPGAIFVRVPAGVLADSIYPVRITNADMGSDTLSAAFAVVAPTATRINGVTKPTGLVGMTVIIEGDAFGDRQGDGKVFFTDATGAPVEALVADTLNDWTNKFIVTSVPQGTADTSQVWVETATGVSRKIDFQLISSGVFSPSSINWTSTTPLPVALQGLGATYVPVESASWIQNFVFTVGGANLDNVATASVFRAPVEDIGALGIWDQATALPSPRAYHAQAAATAYSAALDTATTAAYLYVLGGKDLDGKSTNTVYAGHVNLRGEVTAWASATPLPAALHGAGAAVFRGYLYLAGGADSTNTAQSATYRARIFADGTLGNWETMSSLPNPASHFSLVNFGPYLYAVGGESGTSAPVSAALTGTETGAVSLARINLRTGDLTSAGWAATVAMGKGRSKHSTLFAGGALFVTSGLYSGQPGSSENTYAPVNSDGTLASWNGATGSETISAATGISLYNQASVSFVDRNGQGHVLVLGGADRAAEGRPSASVVYY